MRYKMIFVMLNEQLNDLYRNNLGNLMEMYSVLDGQKIFHYVGPLLIYCWEERYLSSKYRLMIIGQETNDGMIIMWMIVRHLVKISQSIKVLD